MHPSRSSMDHSTWILISCLRTAASALHQWQTVRLPPVAESLYYWQLHLQSLFPQCFASAVSWIVVKLQLNQLVQIASAALSSLSWCMTRPGQYQTARVYWQQSMDCWCVCFCEFRRWVSFLLHECDKTCQRYPVKPNQSVTDDTSIDSSLWHSDEQRIQAAAPSSQANVAAVHHPKAERCLCWLEWGCFPPCLFSGWQMSDGRLVQKSDWRLRFVVYLLECHSSNLFAPRSSLIAEMLLIKCICSGFY